MTISLGAILGAVLAIIIVWLILEGLVRGAAAIGYPVPPIVHVIKWAAFGIFCCLVIAWAFGVDIPFIRITG